MAFPPAHTRVYVSSTETSSSRRAGRLSFGKLPLGPFDSDRLRTDWLANPKANLLSGLVVALALIPEAISFSIIAGVDPKVGLYASFSIAIIISITGGRAGMISAATGAMALVVVSLVADHGVEYLFAATILAGLLQVGLGYLGVGELMRFIPRTVMIGFVNALAVLIFVAQIPHILLTESTDGSELPLNLAFIGLGLAIIYGLPRLTKAVPSPLIAIVVLAGAAIVFDLSLPTVGDMGELPSSLPVPSLPLVPLGLETLSIIFPYAITLALVGLLESLLTAQLLDDMTDSDSDKNTLMNELQEKLNDAFQKLSVKHRTVITLYEIDGLSHKEIAEIVGTSVGTVRSRLHYAKQFLQAELKDYVQ